MNKNKTCTISGLRPQKLRDDLDLLALLGRLDGEIRKSFEQGYTVFRTGMAMGVDIWATERVLALKQEEPEVRLICFQPCETQAAGWPGAWREKYYDALAAADEVVCLQGSYTPGCMQRCNRRMIDASSRLIAVHDGKSSGGTAQTINYAKKRGLDISVINPLDCLRVLL